MPAEAAADRYLVLQERFDAIVAAAFRKHGPRLVDLAYANAYDGPAPRVRDALRRALDNDRDLSFQYSPYGGRTTTRRLVAKQLADRFGLPMNYRDVVLTPGAMAALNVAFRALFGPGDEVLVLTPCWLDYPLYLENLGIPFRFVPLDPGKHLDHEAIAEAITPRTRGVLLTHPGCPSGVLLATEELERLARLLADAERANGSRIYVLGDECHRDILWAGGSSFETVLAHHPRTLSFYSFGKALLLQGQRIGYVAVSPRMPEREEIRRRLARTVRRMGFCTPTSLMQLAVGELLDYQPPLDTIRERQAIARAALRNHGYRVCDAEATFFIYARSPIPDDFEFAERMAERGVLVLPSSLFHEPGWFRLSVTARTEALLTGLKSFRDVPHRAGTRASRP